MLTTLTRASSAGGALGVERSEGVECGAGARRTRILFPYSGTPTARAALELGAEWALAIRAEARVLYVRTWDTSRGGHYFVESPAEARDVADEAVSYLLTCGVSARAVTRDADRGRIAHLIVAYADTLDARAIVLGTRGRGGLSAAVCGSVSRAVARHAETPVVLVRDSTSGSLTSEAGGRQTPVVSRSGGGRS